MVRHLEWRRCAVLGELDCRHRGGRVELRRFPRRHAQLIAGRAHPGRSVAGQRSHFPTRGYRAVVLYRDSGLVQFASVWHTCIHVRSSPNSRRRSDGYASTLRAKVGLRRLLGWAVRVYRNREVKNGAAAFIGGHPYLSFMRLDDRPAD